MKPLKFLLVLAFFSHPSFCFAAAPLFSYETFAHGGALAAPPAFNAALQNYVYGITQARAVALGAIGAEISAQNGPLGAPWAHQNAGAIMAPLPLALAAQMVLNRQLLGIPVVFQHPAAIASTAAGLPLPPGIPANYVQNALAGGGYLMPLLGAIHNLQNAGLAGLIAPILAAGDQRHFILHLHLPTRISKNVKELAYNSLPGPLGGVGGLYITLKQLIDNTYAAAGGLPPPDSATILSSDNIP
jgi:hypothetical protein